MNVNSANNNSNNTLNNNPNHVESHEAVKTVNGYILDVLLEVISILYERFSENLIEIFYTDSDEAKKLEEKEEFVLITIDKKGSEFYGYFKMKYYKAFSSEEKSVFFVGESPFLLQYGIIRKERKVGMVKSVSEKFLFYVEEEMRRRNSGRLYLIAKAIKVKSEKEF